MSYQVLARKWRPRSFQEMVGQEHVLRMLANALDKQRLHHAYLFTGTRGVGKTSLARLLSKCLNCETGISSKPCDTCSTCLAIDAGRFLDLLEIDAASRTKVEDTRELLDNVQYAPTQGRFKIYLIDEVHMLSGHSFNALLKTLEEPPAHVKFILATTDPKRLPVTILSRCLQFNLKRIPVEQLSKQLQHICTTEKIKFEIPAMDQLAQAADGSVRDSLSLLDQAIAFSSDVITADDTRRMLGNVEQDYIYRLLHAVADQDGKKLLSEIALLSEHAPDFNHVLENVLSVLHQIALAQIVTGSTTEENITTLATRFKAEETQLYYQIALLGRRDLPLASSPVQGFEMVMLRMLAFKPTTPDQPTTSSKTPATEKRSTPVAATVTTPTAAPVKEKEATPISNPTLDDWTKILTQLGLTGLSQVLASHCVLEKISDDAVELALSDKHQTLLNKQLSTRLEDALRKYLNKNINLKINLTAADLHTTAKVQEQNKKDQHASAIDSINTDNQVKRIIDVFGATLDVNSVKAIDPT
jgi:DNA polymerase-3 subunit gamma/tau